MRISQLPSPLTDTDQRGVFKSRQYERSIMVEKKAINIAHKDIGKCRALPSGGCIQNYHESMSTYPNDIGD